MLANARRVDACGVALRTLLQISDEAYSFIKHYVSVIFIVVQFVLMVLKYTEFSLSYGEAYYVISNSRGQRST